MRKLLLGGLCCVAAMLAVVPAAMAFPSLPASCTVPRGDDHNWQRVQDDGNAVSNAVSGVLGAQNGSVWFCLGVDQFNAGVSPGPVALSDMTAAVDTAIEQQLGASEAAWFLPHVNVQSVPYYDSGPDPSAQISPALTAAGNAEMIANSSTNPPGETWSWSACAADGSGCVPFATGQVATAAGYGAGTVFEATSSNGLVAMSPVWHGDLSVAAPPGATGSMQGNGLVTPVPATWSGGWDGDFDQTQLAACLNADGSDCTTLTDPRFGPGACANGAAVIDPSFVGRYLRVADRRLSTGLAFATDGIVSPYAGTAWAAGPTTAVAIIGQITPATGPPTANCVVPLNAGNWRMLPSPPSSQPSISPLAPPPSATTSTTATLTKAGVARVICSTGCTATLRATRAGHHVQMRRTIATAHTATLWLTHTALRRLGHGKVKFTLYINGVSRAARMLAIH